jgi:enoyl-CoA hydratase/carnithine racemase
MGELVAVSTDAGVGVMRLQRPEQRNAFNRAMSDAVMAALDALEADGEVRCVLLTGSGGSFSAGADMNEAVAAIDGAGRSEGMGAAIARAARFGKPLIAAVDGPAYGGGALLAITCDIRVASETAAFRFPGAAYGLVVGGAQLPRLVGPAFAKELLFTTRVVQAEEALRMGLVNRVVPAAELDSVVMEMARQVASHSPEALLATKATVDRATEVDEGQRAELEANARLRQSPEHHARFRAARGKVTGRE